MPSPSHRIERAKPLLGTIVRMRVAGLPPAHAHEVIGGAFAIVAEIHRLMSFHAADSELSQLNRMAWQEPVVVSLHTMAVLQKAVEVAQASDGLFDPTIGPALVQRRLLPHPDAPAADDAASWKDIILSADGTVAFAKPLWIDVGGIAKGYAVDRALDHIMAHDPASACVEAGGDLRLIGPGAERVYLAAPHAGTGLPVLEIADAAVASSGSQPHGGSQDPVSPHIDTRTGLPCPTGRFASVVAPTCIEADALTKVLIAAGETATPVLECYGARGFLFEGAKWVALGKAA